MKNKLEYLYVLWVYMLLVLFIFDRVDKRLGLRVNYEVGII